MLSVLSALIVTGLAPANAVDLSEATISGKVTAPAGVDLAATTVFAYTADGQMPVASEQVREDGTYTVNALQAGAYKLEFNGYNNSGALAQWYSGATTYETATSVTVAAGQNLAGINVSLIKGATVSGRITVPAGIDVSYLYVSVQSTGDDWYSASGSVNPDGSYSVRGLPAGTYKIQFVGGNTGAITQWHAAATSFDTATPVTLTAGQALTGINATLVRGASISGTITVPAGADASGVQIEARDSNGNTVGSSSASPEGTYSLRGLPAGSYKVVFSSYGTGLLQQWYPGASSFDTANPVVLAAAQDKTGINAALVTGGSVSGKVTAPAGIDLSSIRATVYEATGPNPNYVASSSLNADGTYTVGGLNTGSYKVQFLGSNSTLLEQWYDGASTFGTATPITVTAGQDHSGADAALTKGASITGKVTSAPGVNLSQVWVYLYDSETLSWAGAIQPAPDGSYEFAGLGAGSYKIQFSTGSSGALGQWYGGAATASTATPVAVSSSQDLTLPDSVLIKGATISGKVTAPAGVDLTAVSVYAYDSTSNLTYPVYTNVQADGSYKLAGLPQGNYVFLFSGYNSGALDQWHANATSRETATVLPVAAGQDVTGINATLVKGASISGKVTVPAGVTLSGVSVSASGAGSPYGTYANVNADGTYRVKGLPAGSYKVKFSNYNSGALDEWYNNVQTEAAATPVVLTAGQDRTAVDAALAKGATIGGKVTLPAGVSAFNVSVSLFKAADGAPVSSVQLNSDGTYALRGVPAGSYKLRFAGYSNTGVLARWYTNAIALATATPVNVTDGQTLTAINATLVKGGVISGKITAPAGTRLTASQVIATKAGTIDDSSVYGYVEPDGTYSIVGLETGSYKLRFLGGQSGAEDLWYGGATAATAKSVAVTAGQSVSGADLTVVTGATISGNVSGASAQPGYLLSVLDSAGKLVKNGYSDEAGNYSVVGLAAGSYKVAFNRSTGYTQDEAQYYQNQPESAGAGQAQSIPVTAGQTVPNINASLTAGASVTGTVLDKAGKPVVSALIQAYTPDGSLVTRSASTSATGKYTLSGLTTGSYIIKVHGALSGRGDLYSGNKTTEATATKVSAVRGSATTQNLSYAAVVETITAPTPTVKGTAKVGSTLTATPGTWGPTGVALKYQWKANGVAITGAAATTFKLTTAQVGKTLTFSVTGTKAGYTTATKTSAATGTVMALNPVLTSPAPKVTGTAKVGYTLTATPGTWGPAPVTLKYQC
ncbi:carboxypeptidase regulatory-like domain-containing protein, partial [Arthrobacter sp. NPDC056493]|uniref:carboxypeptidase regulatory-like domain-containing protein n=1 Tax=Arthrobacter sp. NPDC056493 TaxID=3345839 RepID=UPI00366D2C73